MELLRLCPGSRGALGKLLSLPRGGTQLSKVRTIPPSRATAQRRRSLKSVGGSLFFQLHVGFPECTGLCLRRPSPRKTVKPWSRGLHAGLPVVPKGSFSSTVLRMLQTPGLHQTQVVQSGTKGMPVSRGDRTCLSYKERV